MPAELKEKLNNPPSNSPQISQHESKSAKERKNQIFLEVNIKSWTIKCERNVKEKRTPFKAPRKKA